MIVRKSAAEIRTMARAGRVVARMHEEVRAAIKPGVSTLDLDEVAAAVVADAGATASFKGYGGTAQRPAFPATLCTSLNHEIYHGIPSPARVLAAGDLVKIDAGAVIEGYHADSAATWIVGDAAPTEVLELVAHTREAMWAGVAAVVDGNRLGDVSAAMERVGSRHGYGIVREYGGHGIGRALHEDPHVPNTGKAGRGMRLRPGLVLAVEPGFNLGGAATAELDDGWTVVTADGSLSAHWEHTVAITDDGPWVLTARSDEPEWPLREPERVPTGGEPWRSAHLVAAG